MALTSRFACWTVLFTRNSTPNVGQHGPIVTELRCAPWCGRSRSRFADDRAGWSGASIGRSRGPSARWRLACSGAPLNYDPIRLSGPPSAKSLLARLSLG